MSLEWSTRITLGAGVAALALSCASGPTSGPAPCPPEGAEPRPEQLIFPPGLVDGDAARGEALFATWCARCHSHDVEGRESRLFRGYPRLDCAEWVAGVSDVYLFRIISDGGEALGKQATMKPFAEQLSGQEISDLVAYLRAS
jgi:mono/diheme cytochrome c family protein